MKSTLKNSKGNVLLQVLAATAIMGSSFYFLANYVIGQRQQVARTVNVVKLRFALNSSMDYVLFGLRQKYCFSGDDLLMNDSKCDLGHDGSIERLIMSQDQENFIRQMVADGKKIAGVKADSEIILTQIDRYLKVDQATGAHPLFRVLEPLKHVKGSQGELLKIGAIHVVLKRTESLNLPKSGREIYLQATVSLVDKVGSKTPLKVGSKSLEISSQIAIYPRELGSFALVVPGSLHLDKSWDDASLPVGDVSLHKFANRSEVGNSIGLVFQSPVFINKDIHIIGESLGGGSQSQSYAAVTFAERVHLGNGQVKSSNGLFRPSSSGAAGSSLWSDVSTFGGFLKGIEVDGALDQGLIYLANRNANISIDKTLMNLCSSLGIKQSDWDNISKSEIGSRRLSTSNNEGSYQLFLTMWNSFKPQGKSDVDTSKWGKGSADLKKGKESVVQVKVKIGDRWVSAKVPFDETLKLDAEVGSEKYENDLRDAVSIAKNTLTQETRAENNIKSDLSRTNQDLSKKQSDLQDEKNKPADKQDPKVISDLESDIGRLENKVSGLNQDLTKQTAKKEAAEIQVTETEGKKNQFQVLKSNPPRIEINVSPVKKNKGKGGGGDRYSSDKIDIKMSVKNPRSLLDAKGDLRAPVIEVQAYDNSYSDGQPIQGDPNKKIVGFFQPQFDENGTRLEFPQNISRTENGTSLNISPDSEDVDDLADRCDEMRGTLSSSSFGGAGWDVDFSPSTRASWNFASGSSEVTDADPALASLPMTQMIPGSTAFQVRSIVGKCIIDSTSTFITGFFTCDELEISKRDKPLRIIGTFITSRLKIHPTAYVAGIKWSSIYLPQATRELRAAGVLAPFSSGKNCNQNINEPIWHPIPSIAAVADRLKCNAVSLRSKANPFQWTAVDPDCGLLPGASNTTCKHRLLRFFVVEHSREGGL